MFQFPTIGKFGKLVEPAVDSKSGPGETETTATGEAETQPEVPGSVGGQGESAPQPRSTERTRTNERDDQEDVAEGVETPTDGEITQTPQTPADAGDSVPAEKERFITRQNGEVITYPTEKSAELGIKGKKLSGHKAVPYGDGWAIQKPQEVPVDQAAHEAATSPENALPEPTPAQKEAGNYKKGHVSIHGLDITIENPRGSKRSGTDPNGNRWEVELAHHYGYLKRTEGSDGEHIDVFVGPDVDSDSVFIIDQVNADGSFDEHKVMIGFKNQKAARDGYLANYQDGWKVGPTTKMTMDQFKAWLEGDTSRPVKWRSKQVDKAPEAQAETASANNAESGSAAETGASYRYDRNTGSIQGQRGASGRFQEPSWTETGRGSQLDLFVPEGSERQELIKQAYGTIIKPRTVTTVGANTDTIKSIEDVAHVLASIRKDPQEQFVAIATDKGGKILRVMSYTRGTSNASAVYPLDVAAEASSIDGIHALHLAHNHPSGAASPSDSDVIITKKIWDMLDGTGIKHGDHVIVADRKWASVQDSRSGAIAPRSRTKYSIPITQRRFVKKGVLGEALTVPSEAAQFLGGYDDVLLLLNNRHFPVGIVPMSGDEMRVLRDGGRVSRILSAINTTNAIAAIVKTSDRDGAANMIAMLDKKGVRVLDWIDGDISHTGRGSPEMQGRSQFFSIAEDDNLPPNIDRRIIGDDPVLLGWTMLARNDDVFRLDTSSKKSVPAIINDLIARAEVSAVNKDFAESSDADAGWEIVIRAENGDVGIVHVFQKGKSVWLGVCAFSGAEWFGSLQRYCQLCLQHRSSPDW